jgi:hypothetical protein
MYDYAELDEQSRVRAIQRGQPFLPRAIKAVDITNLSPQPAQGDIYDPATGTFSEPPEADGWQGFIGQLTLDAAEGGVFNDNETEVNACAGQKLTAHGRIVDKDGETIAVIDLPTLRLPILPTDLDGNPLENAQPSMAVASIEKGIVAASWMPEFTGTFAITEHGINVGLPEGQRLKFDGLQIFVLPDTEAQ